MWIRRIRSRSLPVRSYAVTRLRAWSCRGARRSLPRAPKRDLSSSRATGLRDQRNSGDWGGVLILGRAPVNKVEPLIEGGIIGGSYGGTDPNDNSGVFRYVRDRVSAGTASRLNNEVNGLTMGGVGRGHGDPPRPGELFRRRLVRVVRRHGGREVPCCARAARTTSSTRTSAAPATCSSVSVCGIRTVGIRRVRATASSRTTTGPPPRRIEPWTEPVFRT